MGNFRALYNLVFLTALFFSFKEVTAAEKPHEELMVVQTVSKDRHSFVVSKGLKDGAMKGQEIVYANENVSILCKAIEVNRNYSLWVPVDKNSIIPFNKDDFISYNSHAYGNVSLDIVGDINNLSSPEITENTNLHAFSEAGTNNRNPFVNYEEDFKKYDIKNKFSLKASYDHGLSQSSSDVPADQNSSSSGYTFALDYNYRFLPEFEVSFGARSDSQVYRITNPELDIPTSRIMATVGVTYHLMNFSKDKNNYYLTLAAGLGKSTTTINEEQSTGIVTLLPEVRLGYLMPFSKHVALLFEGSVESLSTHEKILDQPEQVTNIVNVKFTIGLRF